MVIYKQVFFHCYQKNVSRKLDNKVMFGVKNFRGNVQGCSYLYTWWYLDFHSVVYSVTASCHLYILF